MKVIIVIPMFGFKNVCLKVDAIFSLNTIFLTINGSKIQVDIKVINNFNSLGRYSAILLIYPRIMNNWYVIVQLSKVTIKTTDFMSIVWLMCRGNFILCQ